MLHGNKDDKFEGSSLGGSLGSKIVTKIGSSDEILFRNDDGKLEGSAIVEALGS